MSVGDTNYKCNFVVCNPIIECNLIAGNNEVVSNLCSSKKGILPKYQVKTGHTETILVTCIKVKVHRLAVKA